MKKLFTFVLAAMAFVACTQNEVEELTVNRADVPETLTVGFEGGDTRVELNETLKTVWTEGDEVSVFSQSYENTRWAFQGTTGDRSGELKRVSGEAGAQTMDNSIVVYPYSDSYAIDADTHAVAASLPAVQSYKEGSYGADGNIMVAQSEFTQFSLKSVCGWLRVELTGEGEVVESIRVRGNDGEQLAGLCYIDAADASVTLASDESYAEEDGEVSGNLNFGGSMLTEVVLNCGDGVELGAEATEFYIALLPQTFEKGMTVEVDYSNGNSQTLVCENNVTIRRNHISPIGIEASEEEDVVNSQIFYTASALVEPYDASAFNVSIVSNEWDEATWEGVITFDGELTTIGYEAFRDCGSLISVTIPDSVTTIGDYAFHGCHTLTSVTIPDSVTTIGGGAFRYCGNLTEFKGKFAADGGRCLIKDNTLIAYANISGTTYTIPDSVTTIGDSAFYGCSLTSVTIPDSVTTIGDYAFRGCTSLTSVTIPDSVTTIGDYAFFYCRSLTSVTIPDNVMTIGDAAFEYCRSLESVTIGDSVTTIGNNAFSECASLTSVTIPDSVTTIGDEAFSYCGSLTSVTIGDSVTSIGGSAFLDCASLTSVTIGDSVTTIGDYAFYGCRSLIGVTIGDSVTAIRDSAFRNCSSLTSVTIGDSVTTIGNLAFASCSSLAEFKGKFAADGGRCLIKDNTLIAYAEASGTTYTIPDNVTKIGDSAFYLCSILTSVTIPDSVTTIGNWAFSNCDSLTSVTIGDSVTTIGDYAFYWCTSLTSVTIGDSVTTIGEGAFAFCESLTSVTIGNSVTTIGDWAFSYCYSLTSVYCKATTPPSLGVYDDVFDYNADGRKIYVPAESVEAYKAAENWSEYAADIVSYDFEAGEEEEVPTNQLWYTATALVKPYDATAFNVAIVSNEWNEATGEYVITFDGELTTIGNRAFLGCDSLTSFTIVDSVTSIGDEAFYDCNNLTSVTIGDSVTTIGNEAFRSCDSLTSVTIGDSVTTIGEDAFYWCSSLTSVTIPDSVTTIGEDAFCYCDNLTSVTIGDSVTTIGNGAFSYCHSLTIVTIPDSVTSIGDDAFSYCRSLTSVTIPDSVTTIGDEVFYYCDRLTSVTIGDSVTTIGRSVFESCESLTSVTIPDSVTTIGNKAFRYCSSLTSVTIPDSVTTIGNNAFQFCSLTSVTIPDSVTTIGNYAFFDCISLTSVYCKATTPPSLGDYVFNWYESAQEYINIGCPIYVPAESVEAYKAVSGWSEYASYIVGYDFE